MRRVAIALALALMLAAPASAEASNRTIAPPGNSGVGQYVETVPTAGGGRPTGTVHPVGGAVGRPGGPGGTSSGGGGAARGGSAITPSTQHALAKQGPAGVAAAALAEATAPQRPRSSARAGHRTSSFATGPASSASAASASEGSSPAASVVKALSGSTSGGGLGPLLPIVLIGSVLAAAVLALMRRRRTS